MSEIFLLQVSPENLERRRILQTKKDSKYKAALHYFNICFGPWDRLTANEPFLGTKLKPPGAGFYPAAMTRDEFEEWLTLHPEDRRQLCSPATVVKKTGDRLVAIPYSSEYHDHLSRAATILKEAASLADNRSLQRFLLSRAEAFLTDNYYQSDLDWMDINSHVEITIGPYEVYEDALFGYKAAFESFVTLTDHEAGEKLRVYAGLLADMEKNLPIPKKHKNLARGSSSPIHVANLIYTGGDARKGIQVSAFNLPNDEQVRLAKGSKKVLLRNVMKAKFQNCFVPVAKRLMDKKQLGSVTFEAYFNHVLFHELSHGLGPGTITVEGGRQTEVRLELKELYSPIEEAKADVVGAWNILYLVDRGIMNARIEKKLHITTIAGLFRAARFGIHEAHGRSVLIQYNYLTEQEAVTLKPTGRHSVRIDRMRDAIRELSTQLLMIEAQGSYSKAADFLRQYGAENPELQVAMKKVDTVPIDIEPVYPLAQEILMDEACAQEDI